MRVYSIELCWSWQSCLVVFHINSHMVAAVGWQQQTCNWSLLIPLTSSSQITGQSGKNALSSFVLLRVSPKTKTDRSALCCTALDQGRWDENNMCPFWLSSTIFSKYRRMWSSSVRSSSDEINARTYLQKSISPSSMQWSSCVSTVICRSSYF